MITLEELPRAVIHVDCDAFFASVEQALDPRLKGKPVITGKERGITAALSYEAKSRGVERGMRISEVKKVCPDAVLLPSDYETYSLISRRLFGILRRFTPDVEEYSIDEAFAELSGLRRIYRTSYEGIALRIKEAVEKELGITVSIGLSLTKTLAKICSRQNKPSGFTCVKGYELHRFLKDIPTERVCGFGPNSTALLAKHGVKTVLDYVNRPRHFAQRLFGKIGAELWHELRGETVYPIVKETHEKLASLSKTKTFTPPSSDKDFVRAQAVRNMESAFIKLRRHHLQAGGLSVILTDEEYQSRGLYAEFSRRTASALEAVEVLAELFENLFDPGLRYRRTGVVLHDLGWEKEVQYDLFEDPLRIKALRELSRVADEINTLYGKHTLHLGSTVFLRPFSQHLGERGDLTSRKVSLLKGESFRQHLGLPLFKI